MNKDLEKMPSKDGKSKWSQWLPGLLSLGGAFLCLVILIVGFHVESEAKGKKKSKKARKPKLTYKVTKKSSKKKRSVASIPSVSSFNSTPFLVMTPHGDVLYPPVAMSDNGQFVVIVLPDRILRSRDFGVTFQMSQVESAAAKNSRLPAGIR